jgi:hypothetical protein
MRWNRSSRLAVATAAATLLAVLAQPGTAGGESSASCFARLNAVRHRVASPPVRALTVRGGRRPLTAAARDHAAYRAWSDARGLRDQTAHHETRGRPGYTGRLPWDRTRVAGLPSGAWLAQAEDVVTGVGVSAAALAGVRAWTDAPYHRFPLLDPNMTRAGCASASRVGSSPGVGRRTWSAEVLDMVWPRQPQVRRIIGYPANGQVRVPTWFDRRTEAPRPFPGAATARVGYVVTLQASGWQAMRVSSMTLSRYGGRLPVYRAVGFPSPGLGRSVDRHLPGNTAMLAAKAPLSARTRYRVMVIGHVRAAPTAPWRRFVRAWSFTTA